MMDENSNYIVPATLTLCSSETRISNAVQGKTRDCCSFYESSLSRITSIDDERLGLEVQTAALKLVARRRLVQFASIATMTFA